MICVHFVRFENEYDSRFCSAVRVFGRPHFVHRLWDERARREIADVDVVVFAKGEWDQPTTRYSYDDSANQ